MTAREKAIQMLGIAGEAATAEDVPNRVESVTAALDGAHAYALLHVGDALESIATEIRDNFRILSHQDVS